MKFGDKNRDLFIRDGQKNVYVYQRIRISKIIETRIMGMRGVLDNKIVDPATPESTPMFEIEIDVKV